MFWRFQFLYESKVFQNVLIRPATNERARAVALSVFTDESKMFQHVLIRPAKPERVFFCYVSSFHCRSQAVSTR